MAAVISPDAVGDILKSHNISFTGNDLEYGRQFRFEDGAIFNVFHSGKSNWQGKQSSTAERVRNLLGTNPLPVHIPASTNGAVETKNLANNKVFIVYGHDVGCREQLELLLRRMKLEPVILQNLVGGGQTIIEKLESSLDVRYACVLLTPDDEGYASGKSDQIRPRARQNVVLELGMFLVRLGRRRVAILHKGDLELPSDINGLIYIRFESRVDEVKERLGAELQEAGFQINIKDLLS